MINLNLMSVFGFRMDAAVDDATVPVGQMLWQNCGVFYYGAWCVSKQKRNGDGFASIFGVHRTRFEPSPSIPRGQNTHVPL
jgi:hypothetical protein